MNLLALFNKKSSSKTQESVGTDSKKEPPKIINTPPLTQIGGTLLDKFFVECVLADISDFSLEKNVARAELFAQKYSLPHPNGVEELFNLALSEHMKLNKQLKINKLEEKKKEERSLCHII